MFEYFPVRTEDGLLKEHWNVIENEVPFEDSVGGLPHSVTCFLVSARRGEVQARCPSSKPRGLVELSGLSWVFMHEHVFVTTPEVQANWRLPDGLAWDEEERISKVAERPGSRCTRPARGRETVPS